MQRGGTLTNAGVATAVYISFMQSHGPFQFVAKAPSTTALSSTGGGSQWTSYRSLDALDC